MTVTKTLVVASACNDDGNGVSSYEGNGYIDCDADEGNGCGSKDFEIDVWRNEEVEEDEKFLDL